jgi:Fe-S cluster biosynthesis and repair protein YggX
MSKKYRYNFSVDVMNELFNFAKLHEYDDRSDFKDAWEIWLKNNEILINDEKRRLESQLYEKDIIDKMYKSARYYFRKKECNAKEKVKKMQYVKMPKELLRIMDDYIISNISSKPKDSFNMFYEDILKQKKLFDVTMLSKECLLDDISVLDKLKKTYKNRYYIISTNSKLEIH